MPDNETITFYQVLPGSPQENVTLEKNAVMYVTAGGSATGTIISGGSMIVEEDGNASNTFVGADDDGTVGSLTVSKGGSAVIATVKDGGELKIYGTVSSATVSSGGTATVYEDGQANNFIIDGGELNLSAGAKVYQISDREIVTSNVIVKNGGQLFVFDGTRIAGVEIISGGYASVNGSMTSAIFGLDTGHCYGSATVRDGAVVEQSTVYDGSVLTVASGGEVKNTTFNIGGKITGNMYKCSDIISNAGIIDFNIVVNDPEDGYLINNLSSFFVRGSDPMLSFYTVTATMDQANGTYKLIQDATGFAEDKTVSIIDYYSGTNVLGQITIKDGTKTIEGRQYTLNLSRNNELTLTVAGGPDIPSSNNADDGWNNELNDRTLALTVIGRDENSNFTYLYDNVTPLDEIMLDKPESVSYYDETDNEFHNFVGKGNDIVDGIDYAKIRFEDDAYVSFSVTATAAVTFSIYQVVDGITKLLQTSTAKKNNKTKKYTVSTQQIYLPISTGEDATNPDNISYYISVAPTNANNNGQAYYRVTVDESKTKIFQGRDGHYDDGTELEEKGPRGDIGPMKKEIIDRAVLAEIREQGEVSLVEDWVGHNDPVDYKLLQFQGGAIANFTVTTTASGKFAVYQFVEEDDGRYTLKKLKKLSLKAGTKNTGEIEFAAGSKYAICMESTVKYADNSYTVSLQTGNLKLYADADDNTDNWLLNKDNTVLNGKIRTFTITSKTESIAVDEAGSVTQSPDNEYKNYVGPGDTTDIVELKMERNTVLSVKIDALSKVRFRIIEVTQSSANKYKTKTLQTKTVNPQTDSIPYQLKTILLLSDETRGENVKYFAVVDSLAKNGDTAYYNLDIRGSEFAPLVGVSDADDKPATADFIPNVTLDMSPITLTTLDDSWIGFGDTVDCRRFNLEHDAVVSFDVEAWAATGFYLYEVKNGKATKVQTTTLLKQANGSYKNTSARIQLKAGTYAYEMKLNSKAAKNFESTYYSVALNTKKSAIFDQIDKINNNDDWKDSSKGASSQSLDKTTVGTLTIANVGKDNPIIKDEWVCLGDAKDCKWFTVGDDTVNAAFSCRGTGNGTLKFGIYSIVRKDKKTYTTKKLFEKKQTADASGEFKIQTGALQGLKAGNNYVIIVQSTTTKNCGYAKYSVTLDTYNVANKSALDGDGISEQSNNASLAMPETSDALAMTDSLSFGQYADADDLANASASTPADFDGISAMQNLTTLA